MPPLSTQAMEPPPAPMLWTLTREMPGISSPMIASFETEISSLMTQLTSNVVPPMSSTTAFCSPRSSSAYLRPATGAMDGPESTE